MAGPWEKYAAQSPQATTGPWTKYATRQAPQQQGAPIQPVTQMTNPKLNIAASGENMPEYVGATGAAGAGLMGGAALGETPLIGPAMKWAGRKLAPYALPAAGSYLINKGRQLPVVGPIIKHIPFAEMLPWLVSGGGKGKAAEAEEGAVAETPLTTPARTLPGMNPPEVTGRPTPGPIAGPSRGLALPGQVERPMPEIPASKVSTTPPKGTPMSKADAIARARAIAQQPGTGVVPPKTSGPQTLVEGQPVPADTDLTSALQKSIPQKAPPPERLQGKIMQELREQTGGRDLTVGIDKLMESPRLKGYTREQVEAAAHKLGDSGKVWKDTVESGPQAGLKGIALRKK